jgi:hypothetical protein
MAEQTATPATEPVQTPPPVATQTPEIVLSDEAKAAGFTAEDFKHPEYGAKAKSLYDGFQKSGERRSKAEKEASEIKAFIQSNPKVLKAVKEQWRELQGLPPEEPAPDVKEPETPDPVERGDARTALSELYAHIGKGDPYAGRAAYFKPDANGVTLCDRVESELRLLNPALPPAEKIRIAMSRVNLQGPPQATTQTPPPPTTSASGETDRGSAGSPPPRDPSKMTDEEIIQRALKKGGYADLPTFLTSHSLTEKARMSGQMR